MDLGDGSQHPEKLITELLHRTKLCWHREQGRDGLKLRRGGGYGAARRSRTEGHRGTGGWTISEVPLGWPWQGLSAAEVGWKHRGAKPLPRAHREGLNKQKTFCYRAFLMSSWFFSFSNSRNNKLTDCSGRT